MGDNSWTTVSHRNRNVHGNHRVHRISNDSKKVTSHVASQAHSSTAPGPAATLSTATLPTVDATVQLSADVPIVAAEESQTTLVFSPNLTTAPAVNSENHSAHNANSGSLKNGTEGSFNTDSIVVESKKTIALGENIGLNMNSCSEHVKNAIQEERFRKKI
ncbi:unnamed protein product [Lactuca virosa]|uniref:Uncharacterized protein n=1 Tax=Lactuca virosa TaxID=75947 RepID=A0AAU9MA94_9ASTR|nr:unnamed protein product [Lactuca virosa]